VISTILVLLKPARLNPVRLRETSRGHMRLARKDELKNGSTSNIHTEDILNLRICARDDAGEATCGAPSLEDHGLPEMQHHFLHSFLMYNNKVP